MTLSFRQIEVFRCLISAGTTTAAAARLSISQPGVSRHIADLEAHLGFRLFDRVKGRLVPTTAGVRLASVVEQNFLGLKRIEQAAENIRDQASHPVVVACLPALSTSLLPRVARYISSRNLSWSLEVDTGTVTQVIEKLQSHSADLAVTLTIPDIIGIEAEALFTVEHVCALPSGHPLAAKEVIEAEDFRGETVIGWRPAGPLSFKKEADVMDRYLEGNAVRLTTHTSHSRYALVAAGLGITLAEPFAAEPWIHQGVVVRRFEPRLPLTYSLCYPSGRIRSEPVSAVRNAIFAAVEQWRSEADCVVPFVD